MPRSSTRCFRRASASRCAPDSNSSSVARSFSKGSRVVCADGGPAVERRGVALGTVPARDPRAERRLAGVGAVSCGGTAAARMVRAALQGCVTPASGLSVLLVGKPRPETKLQPAAARWSPVRAGRPPLVLRRRRQPTRKGPRWPSPATRSALAPLRGRFERLFNASDCLPSRHALVVARELRFRGGRIRRCPHWATYPVDPSTDQCDRNPRCADGPMRETTPTAANVWVTRRCPRPVASLSIFWVRSNFIGKFTLEPDPFRR